MSQYFYDDISRPLNELETSDKGISSEEAANRLIRYGSNVITREGKESYLLKYLKQFTDLLAIILIIASVLALILGSPKDAIIIFAIVVINATIGFIQEFRAEKSIEALNKYVPEIAIVIRNGQEQTINASGIVPGDIVILSEGMKVPADIRLLSSSELYTNDSTITGESESQYKVSLKNENPSTVLADLTGSVFMGTSIASGNGLGLVVNTGMNTVFGSIAKETTVQKNLKSHLEIEVDRIAKWVAKATLFVVVILLAIYTFINGKFDIQGSFEFAIGVASSLVPEGLPATVSIALAIGVQNMTRRKAAIRKLSAVETLGETNIIVTDKTGTLTKNEMTVKEMFFNNNEYHIKGVGYTLNGEITCEGKLCNSTDLRQMEPLFAPIIYANKAVINHGGGNNLTYLGDPTELALLFSAEKADFDTKKLQDDSRVTVEIPFNSERKYMGIGIKIKETEFFYFKGATNVILDKCSFIYKKGDINKLSNTDIKLIKERNDSMSQEALRVIAVAYKEKGVGANDEKLIFVGLFGMIDPPREDVAETIQISKKAGIRTIMVTGDYGLTAAAIAKRIKLNENPIIYTGEDLNKFTDQQLKDALQKQDIIFSRVDPIHKLKIVKCLQAMGNTVAVTGDGVNDAPALKKSDIGVAMGLSGTDVAKEAAEMVSLNDSFSSIVWAIKEGRIVYENIKKVTRYVFTSNLAEFTAIVVGLVLGLAPITAIQILLIDLGAEVFPAIGLAGDKEEDDVMSKPPRRKDDHLFGKETTSYIFRSGIMMGTLGVIAFCLFGFLFGEWKLGRSYPGNGFYIIATTVTYATIALGQYVNSFSIRSMKKPIWLLLNSKRIWLTVGVSIIFITSLIYLPYLSSFGNMKSVPINSWLAIILPLTFVYAIYLETIKFLKNRKSLNNL